MPPHGLKTVKGKEKGMATKVAEKAAKILPNEDFKFISPPEAPVFEPTQEEFEDPLAFIAKIRPVAEKAGICKIRPPNDWQPPFAVDVDNFKFVPRIQRLNELEAKTRVKLNFFDQIAKFWELQGSTLKIPMIDRKALDLYSLHQCTLQKIHQYELFRREDKLTQERAWLEIALKMGYPAKRGHAMLLKHHYERILLPYDIFLKHPPGEAMAKPKKEDKSDDDDDDDDEDDDDEGEEYKLHQIPSRQAVEPPREKSARRSKRYGICDPGKGSSDSGSLDSKELRRLLFYGAGPKMAGYNDKSPQKKKNSKKGSNEFDPLAKYVCHTCERGDSEESMLLCDGCDDSYHTFCLVPPLHEIPKGDWRCPKCLVEEVSKPLEAFGFEQAQREYSLQQFCEMADRFKCEYFNTPVHLVPTSEVEREFWRLVSSIDEDVTVEYGADLHTMDHGSGFPTAASDAACEYAKSKWNLNNLPVLEGSVLGHINADISGMKVPWMYVGMCFATFCWHNEDHWSYSINYLHWGEPKTWYGVPGSSAEAFEGTMKQAAPELFQSQPDLLHQLVTIMNPNILMKDGVPVFRTDQNAGEFVVTFPRAYHAGFNQGFNFAEAVNFAPADWLHIGRDCISHYSRLRRFCVFSHDELVCKMASEPKDLELGVADAAYKDMHVMLETEKKLRKSLLEWGVRTAERKTFETMQDDERQCDICKTTCFLSAVTCDCPAANPKGQRLLACLRHYTELCSCPPASHKLWYRYTLDELPVMLRDLKLRAESFDNWVSAVKDALDFNTPKTLDLGGFKALLQEAEEKKFPDSELLQALRVSVQEATKCANVAAQLGGRKTRNRARSSQEPRLKLTVEELQLFVEEIDELPCILRDAAAVKDVLDKVREFQTKASALLSMEPSLSRRRGREVRDVLDLGLALDVELAELAQLRDLCLEEEWLDKAVRVRDGPAAELEEVSLLMSAGAELPEPRRPATVALLEELREMEARALNWRTRAKAALDEAALHKLELLDREAEEMSVFVTEMTAVEDAVKTAAKWKTQAEEMNTKQDCPELEQVEALVLRGQACPARPPGLAVWEERIRNARAWREKTCRTFLFRDTPLSLVDALLPRSEVGVDCVAVKRSHKEPIRDEVAAILDLQESNTQKRLVDTGDETYCICKKPFTGVMLRCEICYDWFHARCVPLADKFGTLSLPHVEDRIRMSISRQIKFLCPVCQRTRRPQFKTVYQLLSSIEKLGVQMVEARVLHNLCQRALVWKKRARDLLSQEQAMLGSASDIGEHSYSAASAPPSPTKHCRKSPLIPRQEAPVPQAAPDRRRIQMELLMLEGDLMELELEENVRMWNLLHSMSGSLPLGVEPDELELRLEIEARLEVKNKELDRYRDRQRRQKRKADDDKGSRRRSNKPNKRSKKLQRPSGQEPSAEKAVGAGESLEEEEEDEDCSAMPCLRPTGSEVTWVRCDGACELWFHLHCIGLDKGDISEKEDYICAQCNGPNPEQRQQMQMLQVMDSSDIPSQSARAEPPPINLFPTSQDKSPT